MVMNYHNNCWHNIFSIDDKDLLFPEKHERIEDRYGCIVKQSSLDDPVLHQTYYVLRQVIRDVNLRKMKAFACEVSVAEWLGRRSSNPEASGLSPMLATG